MAILRALCALIFLCGVFSVVEAKDKKAPLTLEALNELVDAANFIVGDGNGWCSGSLISSEHRLILTNHHCIARAVTTREIKVVGPEGTIRTVKKQKLKPVTVQQKRYQKSRPVGGSSYTAEIVGHTKSRDLALLQITDLKFKADAYFKIMPEGSDLERGQTVWAIGNPMMLDATVLKGLLSSIQREFEFPFNDDPVRMLQHSAGSFGGSSGGALIDEQGRLIGVPSMGSRAATFIGLAIPPEDIRHWLREWCWSIYDRKFDRKLCLKNKKDKAVKEKISIMQESKVEKNLAPGGGGGMVFEFLPAD